MKPDDFSDQIRRKLESVEPEFQEKDWTRMQQALGHSTPVFAIGTRTGLLAAASIAAIVAFGGVAYQQYHTNQQLREQVQTLEQTVTTLRKTQPTEPAPTTAAAPVLRDTVYLTRDVVRYVPVPYERTRTDGANTDDALDRTQRLANGLDRSYSADRNPSLPSNPNATGTPTTSSNRPVTDATAERTRPGIASNGTVSEPSTNRQPAGTIADRRRPTIDPANESAQNQANSSGSVNGTPGTNGVENDVNSRDGAASEQNKAASNQTVALSLLTIQPFRHDTTYYQEGMARTARRMRRMLSTLSSSGTALAKVDVNRSEPTWNLRLGPGANLGWRQWSAGLFGEIRLSNHWRLGLGLSSVTLQGGSYLTDIDYQRRVKQDFRQKFAPGIDPRHDIVSIKPSGSSVQIPFMLSYRMGLGSGWSLVPSAGINLSVSNREEIGFAYLRGPGIVEPVTIVRKMPQRMLHAGSATIYLEKNWGDWALQLGPYASMPLSNDPSRLNVKTSGASARLLYQVDWNRKR